MTIALEGMSLKPGLKYNKNTDIIITGFEKLGKFGCSNHVAHEAVVVIVRGLTLRLRWKQVLGYYAPTHSRGSDLRSYLCLSMMLMLRL